MTDAKLKIAGQFIKALPHSVALGMELTEIGDGSAEIAMDYVGGSVLTVDLVGYYTNDRAPESDDGLFILAPRPELRTIDFGDFGDFGDVDGVDATIENDWAPPFDDATGLGASRLLVFGTLTLPMMRLTPLLVQRSRRRRLTMRRKTLKLHSTLTMTSLLLTMTIDRARGGSVFLLGVHQLRRTCPTIESQRRACESQRRCYGGAIV